MPDQGSKRSKRGRRKAPRGGARAGLRGGLLALGIAVAAGSSAALAQTGGAQAGKNDQPVLLNADELTYDETLGLVTASGDVELAQGDRLLLADRVSFNEKTRVVTATGNIRMLEPSGDVVFAEYAELTDDMAQGFVRQVRSLLSDNSRVAGTEAERTDGGRYMRINRAVYSPCDLCADDPTRAPLWQLRANRVVHDREAKEVIYRDARLEMFGVPVLYTPYFSHPDPSVDRKSGFLSPVFGYGGRLGTFASVPYYWSIAPDMDATITPLFSTEDGLQVRGEWRQRFENGRLFLDGSLVNADRTTNSGEVKEDRWRGHLFGNGLFNLDETWRAGFDVQQTSDRSYLRRYRISSEDILTSRAFVEGFQGRNYAVANAYRFDDLRDIYENEPYVIPLAEAQFLGEPGAALGGRWSLDLGLVGLQRPEGRDTQRTSIEAGWQREFVADAGLITTVSGTLRGDAYYATDYVRADDPSGREDSSTDFRLFPQGQISMRYPIARQIGSVQHVIEPIVSFTTSPALDDQDDIPNEDSQDIELTPYNLFRANRFPGVDRLDSGTRVTYGVNTGFYGFGGGSSEFFLGQSYQFSENNETLAASGLGENSSDIVGSIRIQPGPYLDLQYNFQLAENDLEAQVQQFRISAGAPILRASANYYYRDRPTSGQTATRREYLTTSLSSSFSQHWSAAVAQSRDLQAEENQLRSTSASLTYSDECFTFQIIGSRDNTVRSGEEGGDSIYFRLVFRNLGEVEAPILSSSSTASTQ
ncbi:organic solvent tolerance protein [Skermanella stibiiresistens SB22]|uniref:LPS-assembly protein LptD n=1 Tax=Skermanella stibiiresistens SB22 TaxID=1385369 RepID=W9H9G4_9PROT|nr:LPS assembly protein LptD [Skermanella stibiiresistens]EWY41332.1 organic solvent tolerance protein [Skermanella stibiiresistens SB22]